MKNPEFIELREQIKSKHKNKFIFVSIDVLYNKFFCLRNKLEGYVHFLRENGKKCEEENVLIQYISIDEEFIQLDNKLKFDLMKQEIKTIEARIHKEFSPGVLEIIEKKLTYTERLAVLSAGNCLLRTNLRLGFSLDIYDFLNLKTFRGEKEEFCYILSEAFSTLSSLSGAIIVSPFNVKKFPVFNLNLVKFNLNGISNCISESF